MFFVSLRYDKILKRKVITYPKPNNGNVSQGLTIIPITKTAIAPNTKITALLWDERMSTMSAERVMLEGDLSRSRRGKSIDSVAASIILQSFLDFLRYQLPE